MKAIRHRDHPGNNAPPPPNPAKAAVSAPPTLELAWLVERFAERTPGVEHAVVVSPGGLLLAGAGVLAVQGVEQLSATVSGVCGLAAGAAWLFGKGKVEQVLLRMRGGHLMAVPLGDGAEVLAVLTWPGADVTVVAHRMGVLADDAAHALTPGRRSVAGVAA